MGAAAAVGTLLLMTVALATSVRRQRVGGGAGDEGGATVVGGSVVECTRVARLFETKLSDWSEKSVGMREISRASRAASGAAGISGPCALSFVPAGSPAYYGPGGQVSVEGRGVVQLNASAHYQKITGFGGAFTDAAGLVWQTLPHTVRERVVELYFGVTGIGYTLGRVHINSCDFSVDSYVDHLLARRFFSSASFPPARPHVLRWAASEDPLPIVVVVSRAPKIVVVVSRAQVHV